MMKHLFRVVAIQGTMQVAMIVLMARFATGLWNVIRKSGRRYSLATNAKRLRGTHAQTKRQKSPEN